MAVSLESATCYHLHYKTWDQDTVCFVRISGFRHIVLDLCVPLWIPT